jgi:hypothetical protein
LRPVRSSVLLRALEFAFSLVTAFRSAETVVRKSSEKANLVDLERQGERLVETGRHMAITIIGPHVTMLKITQITRIGAEMEAPARTAGLGLRLYSVRLFQASSPANRMVVTAVKVVPVVPENF